MLSISNEKKTASSSTASSSNPMSQSKSEPDILETYDVLLVDDDFSGWELVNPSPSSDEEDFSFSESEDVVNHPGAHLECESERGETEEEARASRDASPPPPHADVIISMGSLSVSPPKLMFGFSQHVHHHHDVGHVHHDDDVEEEEDVYSDDAYGLDDELVPWKLKGKLGRQRMRKMGKRVGPKIKNSKRLPYYQTSPGCMHGKHGLGVQHIYI